MLKTSKNVLMSLTLFFLFFSNLYSQEKHFSDSLHISKGNFSFEIKANLDSPLIVDSVIVKYDSGIKIKHSYYYDLNGNRTIELEEEWSGNKWVNERRRNFTYNSENNLTVELFERWYGDKKVNVSRETYMYNTNGMVAINTSESWRDSLWVNTGQFVFEYDFNGNIISEILNVWDADKDRWLYSTRLVSLYAPHGGLTMKYTERWRDGIWVNGDFRESYIYDSHRNITVQQIDSWDGIQWMGDIRNSYTYNSNDNMILHLKERWDSRSKNDWENYSLIIYNYNVDEKLIYETRARWDESIWVNSMQFNYQYDSNGNTVLRLVENWNDGKWENYYKNIYSYNDNGLMSSFLKEDWNGVEWMWDYRYSYTYNSNGNITSYLNEKWNGYQWEIFNGSVNFADLLRTKYYLSGAEIAFFYSPLTNIEEIHSNTLQYRLLQNYPNPFNPSTTINYSLPQNGFVELKVYDVLGREVSSLVHKEQSLGNYEVEFNASNLTSGIYFYKLKCEGFSKTKKLILLK